MQRASKCGHLQGHKHICEFAQSGFIYKSICDMIYIYIYTYTCEHVHVYKEVQSWSIRKGTNKCESAQHRSIYQHIRDMILDICIFVSI